MRSSTAGNSRANKFSVLLTPSLTYPDAIVDDLALLDDAHTLLLETTTTDAALLEAIALDEMAEVMVIATEAHDASTMTKERGTGRLPDAPWKTIPLLPLLVAATMTHTAATILPLLLILMPMADRHMTDLLVTSLLGMVATRGKGTHETTTVPVTD